MTLALNKNSSLTPGQEKVISDLNVFVKSFNAIFIKGDSGVGKNYTVQQYFSQNTDKYDIITLDVCQLCKQLVHRLNSQDFVHYLESILPTIKQTEVEYDKVFDELDNRADNRSKRYKLNPNKLNIIYIRRFDRILDLVSDFRSENRLLTPIIFKKWLETLPHNVQIVGTTVFKLPTMTSNILTLDLEFKKRDVIHLLQNNNVSVLTPSLIEKISKFARTQTPLQILHCLRYAQTLQLVHPLNSDDILQEYKRSYCKFTGFELERDMTEPDPSVGLIGMENILSQLQDSLIYPFELNHTDIPIPRGIIIAGPSGTGKTALGRWIAYKLRGKLFSLPATTSVTGPSFNTNLEELFKKAINNAPAIIFMDDADIIFEYVDNYRVLLTLLDGLHDKHRNDVCVIVTCMDYNRIPACLIRGRRLELTFQTKLPKESTIDKLLQLGVDKIGKVFRELNQVDVNCTVSSLRFTRDKMKAYFWNCADIQNAMDIVLRKLLATYRNLEPQDKLKACIDSELLNAEFEIAISSINKQYKKCKYMSNNRNDDTLSYYS
jgi:Cdc6-like AAA superfamily ATPase